MGAAETMHTTQPAFILAYLPGQLAQAQLDKLAQAGPVHVAEPGHTPAVYIARVGGAAMPKGFRVLGLLEADGRPRLAVPETSDIDAAARDLAASIRAGGIQPLERVRAALRAFTAEEAVCDDLVDRDVVSVFSAGRTRLREALSLEQDTHPHLGKLHRFVTDGFPVEGIGPFTDAVWERSRPLLALAMHLAAPEHPHVRDMLLDALNERVSRHNRTPGR